MSAFWIENDDIYKYSNIWNLPLEFPLLTKRIGILFKKIDNSVIEEEKLKLLKRV
jgi:hypothetical protein